MYFHIHTFPLAIIRHVHATAQTWHSFLKWCIKCLEIGREEGLMEWAIMSIETTHHQIHVENNFTYPQECTWQCWMSAVSTYTYKCRNACVHIAAQGMFTSICLENFIQEKSQDLTGRQWQMKMLMAFLWTLADPLILSKNVNIHLYLVAAYAWKRCLIDHSHSCLYRL